MAEVFWTRTTIKQICFGAVYNNTLDWMSLEQPDVLAMQGLNEEVEDTVLATMNSLQHAGCGNVSIFSQWRGNSNIQHLLLVGGTGDLTLDATAPKPQADAFFYKSVDPVSYEWADNTQEVPSDRRIRMGGFHLGGITEDWQEFGASVIPSALATQVNQLILDLETPITANSVDFIAVVHGFALAAKPAPNPLSARNECYAVVNSVQFKHGGWMGGRKGIYP